MDRFPYTDTRGLFLREGDPRIAAVVRSDERYMQEIMGVYHQLIHDLVERLSREVLAANSDRFGSFTRPKLTGFVVTGLRSHPFLQRVGASLVVPSLDLEQLVAVSDHAYRYAHIAMVVATLSTKKTPISP